MTPHLPLVLIPGLLCSARLFTPQIEALWPFGQVAVADHRRDADMDSIAMRILAAAPPRFALAGLSMGGYIALAIMRLAPERITKLALLDTSARPDRADQKEGREKFIAMAQAGRLADVVPALRVNWLHRNRQADEALLRVVNAMAEDVGAEAFMRQLKAIMARQDSRPLLPQIKCPTLVLVGDGDASTPPELANEMAGGIPGAKLVVVPDCGHLSTLEKPDAVNAALKVWLSA